eukprot:1159557-Pelagomonas_calceolata.AAC.10
MTPQTRHHGQKHSEEQHKDARAHKLPGSTRMSGTWTVRNDKANTCRCRACQPSDSPARLDAALGGAGAAGSTQSTVAKHDADDDAAAAAVFTDRNNFFTSIKGCKGDGPYRKALHKKKLASLSSHNNTTLLALHVMRNKELKWIKTVDDNSKSGS